MHKSFQPPLTISLLIKIVELLQLSALIGEQPRRTCIIAINVILDACRGLIMLDSPSLKVLMNNQMTHLIEFVIQHATRIRNRAQVLIIKKGICKKNDGYFSAAISIKPGFHMSHPSFRKHCWTQHHSKSHIYSDGTVRLCWSNPQ